MGYDNTLFNMARFGQYNKLIEFYKQVDSSDGYGQESVDYEFAFDALAKIVDIKANERYTTDRFINVRASKITMRYNPNINTTMRVKYKSYWFDIIGIAGLDYERETELTVQEIENNDNYNG